MQFSSKRLRTGSLCRICSLEYHSLEREVLIGREISWRVLSLPEISDKGELEGEKMI